MAELMYKITNLRASDIRNICNIRPEMSAKLVAIVVCCLLLRSFVPSFLCCFVALVITQQPAIRSQVGKQFATDLRSVIADLLVPAATFSPSDDVAVAIPVRALPAAESGVFDAAVVQKAPIYEAN